MQNALDSKLPTTITTTGDLIYSSSGTTPSRLPIGSNNQVLTVSGGLPTWQNPATEIPSQSGEGGKFLTTDGTNVSWDEALTPAGVQVVTNKDIDGGTASNTSRLTIPRAATIEAAAALVRKKATLLYNDFTNKFLKDNGTDLKSIPDFGDVNIFAQEIAADNVIGSWTQNLSGITATFTKGT